MLLRQLKTAATLFLMMTLITGLIYPLFITLIAQIFFNWQANGSLIQYQGKTIGSALIGQTFTDPKYFWGRPSATTPYSYNAANSSGSNLGPSNPTLLSTIKTRVDYLHKIDPNNSMLIPVDLVTASGSGLDPDISPLAAMYQVHRIATARGLPEAELQSLIQQYMKNRSFYILGEPRVNVLDLNIMLDGLK